MLCWLKSHVSWKGMDPESVKCLEYFSLFPQCSQSVLKFFYNPTYPLRHLMRPIFGSKWDNLIYLPPPLFFPGDSALVSKRVNKGFSLNGQGLLIWSRSSKSIWAATRYRVRLLQKSRIDLSSLIMWDSNSRVIYFKRNSTAVHWVNKRHWHWHNGIIDDIVKECSERKFVHIFVTPWAPHWLAACHRCRLRIANWWEHFSTSK